MNVKVALFNSLGFKLDSTEVTVNTDDDDCITFAKLGASINWSLADGDTIRIETSEQ